MSRNACSMVSEVICLPITTAIDGRAVSEKCFLDKSEQRSNKATCVVMSVVDVSVVMLP